MNGSTVASTSNGQNAEQIARAAKLAFDTAQTLENASEERIRTLTLLRDALSSAKAQILEANALDMDVSQKIACFAEHIDQLAPTRSPENKSPQARCQIPCSNG